MYTIYASKTYEGGFFPYASESFERADLDATTTLCMRLVERGYVIEQVVLPDGTLMDKEEIQRALNP